MTKTNDDTPYNPEETPDPRQSGSVSKIELMLIAQNKQLKKIDDKLTEIDVSLRGSHTRQDSGVYSRLATLEKHAAIWAKLWWFVASAAVYSVFEIVKGKINK